MAVFGMTAKQWRTQNPELALSGYIRYFATIIELQILSNLESLNSVLIEREEDKEARFHLLINTAISQYRRFSLDVSGELEESGNDSLAP